MKRVVNKARSASRRAIPDHGFVHIQMPRWMIEKLDLIATEEMVSRSSVVKRILAPALK